MKMGCILLWIGIFAAIGNVAEVNGYLREGFYDEKCPCAENLVKHIVGKYVAKDPTLAASLLRMHFHDCFVRVTLDGLNVALGVECCVQGCDGSVLLNSTKNEEAEKEATPNLTLRGFHVVDAVKAELEKHCPGVVSCADILALAARDAVSAGVGGPFWAVPTGRRDGIISRKNEPFNNLPHPTFNFSQLLTYFSKKGLTVKYLVVLSGGHTVGIAHCNVFGYRLYNFTGKGDMDPSLEKSYALKLKNVCKNLADNTTRVPMDPRSFLRFDNHYYHNLKLNRGLFHSDAALLTNPISKSYVHKEVEGSSRFFADFRKSIEKMGRIGVLTGSAGEIRRLCAFVNR